MMHKQLGMQKVSKMAFKLDQTPKNMAFKPPIVSGRRLWLKCKYLMTAPVHVLAIREDSKMGAKGIFNALDYN